MTLTATPPAKATQPLEDEELAALDELIPPPLRPIGRFLVAAALVAMAMAAAILVNQGYVFPRPGAHIREGSTSQGSIALDLERDVVGVLVALANSGGRDLRLTDLSLDAPGVELIDFEVHQFDIFDSPFSSNELCPYGVWDDDCRNLPSLSGEPSPLPVTVPATHRTTTQVLLWVRPTSCESVEAPWGIIEATFDFGSPSLPPFSVTNRLDRVPIWSEQDAAFRAANGVTTLQYPQVRPDGELVEAASYPELICELLR